jgi:hypothetical protein
MQANVARAPEVIGKLMADEASARNLRAWDLAGHSESPGLPVYIGSGSVCMARKGT